MRVFRYTKVSSRIFGQGLLNRRPTILHFLQITENFGLLWETKAEEPTP